MCRQSAALAWVAAGLQSLYKHVRTRLPMRAARAHATLLCRPARTAQDKTTALVSSEANRRRAEEQAALAQEATQQAQAALAAAQAQLSRAEQRSAPGTMVPVGEVQKLVLELEKLQQQLNELERQQAEKQHRAPRGAEVLKSACSAPGGGGVEAEAGRKVGSSAAGGVDDSPLPARCSLSQLRSSSSKVYRPCEYGANSGTASPQQTGSAVTPQPVGSQAAAKPVTHDLEAQLLEKDVALFDAQLQREQAAADAERHRCRLHSLLDSLSPHPLDAEAAATIAKARELAGLAPLPSTAAPLQAGAGQGARAATAAAGGRARSTGGTVAAAATVGMGAGTGASKQRQPTGREQELLDTIALLKAALERTKKGLESGVSSSKYMAAVDKAKQLRARCQVGGKHCFHTRCGLDSVRTS